MNITLKKKPSPDLSTIVYIVVIELKCLLLTDFQTRSG